MLPAVEVANLEDIVALRDVAAYVLFFTRCPSSSLCRGRIRKHGHAGLLPSTGESCSQACDGQVLCRCFKAATFIPLLLDRTRCSSSNSASCRRWIQAVFHLREQQIQSRRGDKDDPRVLLNDQIVLLQQAAHSLDSSANDTSESYNLTSVVAGESLEKDSSSVSTQEAVVDLSEGCAAELFGGPPAPEVG
jgi:hypothetical protein